MAERIRVLKEMTEEHRARIAQNAPTDEIIEKKSKASDLIAPEKSNENKISF